MKEYSIHDIKVGDERAFEHAYEQYHQKLYAYFIKKTGSVTVSRELVQITFIKLWRFRENLNEHLVLDMQLFRIARTCAIDVLREQARSRELTAVTPDLEQLPLQAEESGSIDKIKSLYYYLPSLSPMRRKIMECRLAGLTNHEIASSLELSPKTVENQVNRAVRDLRKKLNLPVVLIVLLLSYPY